MQTSQKTLLSPHTDPPIRWLVRVAAAVILPCALGISSAFAQMHARDYGDFTVRSSTVGTENLSAETAAAHGIVKDPRRGVLNVTVLRNDKQTGKTVPATVSAYIQSLTGQKRHVDLREVTAEGRVSYMGTYGFTNGEVLDFHIDARPFGSSETLTLTFRDRLWSIHPGK